ncbi:protein-export chaperone SecB [Burkholderia cenocepacia]|uniref:protein-export chaperone SecB n=1 Tax=Burkholderia cenocepacia TaxID=95486 RepID=UPI00158F6548|nr:protein-export chaperone SecB [Burkholderia cenocepacia]
MELSPIQLVNLRFLKILVEPTTSVEIDSPHPRNESPFDFGGVQFQSELGHGYGEAVTPTVHGENVEVQPYVVTLAVRLLGAEGKIAPYRIDVKCVGYFNVLTEAFPEEARRQNVVVVNGAAMLYGAIREMVSNITARSWHGELLLPAMSFLGEAPNKLEQ